MANNEQMEKFLAQHGEKTVDNGKAAKHKPLIPVTRLPKGGDLIVAKLDAANKLLAEAKTAQDAKKVIDVAAAAETYSRRQALGEEAIQYARSIKVYATRKLGQILKQTPKRKGQLSRGTRRVQRGNQVLSDDATPSLAELGISRNVSSRAQKLADLPDEQVAEIAEGRAPIHPLEPESDDSLLLTSLETLVQSLETHGLAGLVESMDEAERERGQAALDKISWLILG